MTSLKKSTTKANNNTSNENQAVQPQKHYFYRLDDIFLL